MRARSNVKVRRFQILTDFRSYWFGQVNLPRMDTYSLFLLWSFKDIITADFLTFKMTSLCFRLQNVARSTNDRPTVKKRKKKKMTTNCLFHLRQQLQNRNRYLFFGNEFPFFITKFLFGGLIDLKEIYCQFHWCNASPKNRQNILNF